MNACKIMNENFNCIWAAFLLSGVLGIGQAHGASFRGLGDLPNGIGNSQATAVSSDGSVVVGFAQIPSYTGNIYATYDQYEGFVWTQNNGMIGLGFLEFPDSGGGHDHVSSWARGVSGDGTSIVGASYRGDWGSQAFMKSGSGTYALGVEYTWALAISQDGSTIVGYKYGPLGHACVFLGGAEVRYLDFLGTGASMHESRANSVSADGSVIVGYSSAETNNHQACRWTASAGVEGLGFLEGGTLSQANAVSADGSVIVGYSSSNVGTRACRWTQDGVVDLGALPGSLLSYALGVSGDGEIVVGYAWGYYGNTYGSTEAFLWSPSNGMENLRNLLVSDCGLDLTGWSLTCAQSVSADGSTIVGYGSNPLGATEAWVAVIPEPATLALVALGGLALLRRSRRK